MLAHGDRILGELPEDGSTISRSRISKLVREKFGRPPTDDEFDAARNHMAALGLLRYRSGIRETLRRTTPVKELTEATTTGFAWRQEQNLYRPISRYLRLAFWRDPNLDLDPNVFVSITGNQRHRASGRWRIPDLVLVSTRSFPMLNRIEDELITFEVKPQHELDAKAPRQAAEQAIAGHRGYVVWHCADEGLRRRKLAELLPSFEDCGIGLIVTSTPNQLSSYRIEKAARSRIPETLAMNNLLDRYLTLEAKAEFAAWNDCKGHRR